VATTIPPGNFYTHFFFLIVMLCFALKSDAQTYNMSPVPVTLTCPTTAVFADPSTTSGIGGDGTCQTSGGSSLDYQDNMNMTETFCTSNGQCLTLTYSSLFSFTLCTDDTLYIYDGPNTSSPLLNWGTNHNMGKYGFFTDSSNAGPSINTITTSGPCVTFKFVSDNSGHAKGWRIAFGCTNCTPAPANDNYTGAQSLSVGSTCSYTTGTTYHAVSTSTCSTAPACTGAVMGAGNPDDDVWYTFTTGATQTTATVTVVGQSPMDPVFQVFSGTCGTFSQVTCVNNNSTIGGTETSTFSVSANTTYYLRIYDYATNGGTNGSSDAFQVCVTGSTPNDCAGATEVCSTSSFTHTNSGGVGTQEYGTGSWPCLFGEHNSAWYTFKANTSGNLQFNVASTNTSQYQDIDWSLWGPFTSSSSICTLTPHLSSSYAVPNSAPSCPGFNFANCNVSLPAWSTGISCCENAGTNCEGAGGNGNLLAYNQTVSIVAGDYYLLLVDIFTGWTGYTLTWTVTNGGSFWDCTLPIQLLEFSGNVEGDVNLLNWSTATEQSNSYFSIEHSLDAETFDSIGVVAGAGNSTTQRDYDFIDTHPFAGKNYYRLKQVDDNGGSFFTNIIELDNTPAGFTISNVYPNPTNGLTNIDINSNDAVDIQMEVTDALGRVLLEHPSSLAQGRNTISVDLSNFTTGIYYLNVRGTTKQIKVFAKVVKI